MSAVRCDKCDAACTEAEVRDGWCGNCGKRLPAYLLHPRAAEPDVPASGDVEFRSEYLPRLVAFLVLTAGAASAAFGPIWIATHPPQDPRKVTEAVVVAVFLGVMAVLVFSIALGRLRAGRLVVGEDEVRIDRPFAGGLGPFLVTDRIPFAAVERFGFGYTPEDTDLFVTPGSIPTVMFRAGGRDYRIVLKEYENPGRILRALQTRLKHPPETIVPGWLGLGKFR